MVRFLLADIRLLREKYFRSYGRVAIMAVDEVRYLKLIRKKVVSKVGVKNGGNLGLLEGVFKLKM